MTLRVNNIRSAEKGLTPRVQQGLVVTDLDRWSPFANGTGVLPTYSGTSKDTATFTKTSGTGRSFLGTSVDVEAGKTYTFGAFVNSRNATLVAKNIFTNATISEGSVDIKDNNANQWWCVKFTSSVTETLLVRLGIGTNANETGSVTSLVMSKPFFFEMPSISSPIPEYVAGFQDMGLSVKPAAAFSHAPGGYLTADEGGQVNFTSADAIALQTPLTPRPYTVGMFVGDSFSNDTSEWPNQIVALDGQMVLLGNGTSGASLDDFNSVFQDLIDLDSFDYTGDVKPEFIIIQGSVNSPNESFTVDQMLASYLSMINKAKAAGIHPIVTNIPPYGQSSSYNSNSEGVRLSGLNQRLGAFATLNGAGFVDIFSALVDSTGYKMKEEYVSADTLHPSAAGSIKIAQTILSVIKSLRLGQASSQERSNVIIDSQTTAATSSAFTVQPSQDLEIFAAPGLGSDEFVTIEVNDVSLGWRTMGVIIGSDDTSGFIVNNKRVAQEYRVTKSATQTSTRIEFN
jgi:lysophospholipase L1-like esterase